MPILDLMMYKDVKQLQISDVSIYSKIFGDKDIYVIKEDEKRKAKQFALSLLTSKNMLWLANQI